MVLHHRRHLLFSLIASSSTVFRRPNPTPHPHRPTSLSLTKRFSSWNPRVNAFPSHLTNMMVLPINPIHGEPIPHESNSVYIWSDRNLPSAT
ncbi:hypothetical protein BX666DRAFT_1924923 [Dichotomocladium elegans]|nr:hypothetical protein BX666DRAFT_1924923 [Dichotomocladium elegans]